VDAELRAAHGLTVVGYEALLLLSEADERALRRIDLARGLGLTASGVTRLLDGLERAGFVERGTCDTDRRVVYAVLTEAGSEKLRAASETHITQIDDLFGSQLDEQELVALADMTRRLREAASDVDCRSPDDA
jgi:MarR family transcriptional regulator, 2-MHQ and catechol-resistance regulon repressor